MVYHPNIAEVLDAGYPAIIAQPLGHFIFFALAVEQLSRHIRRLGAYYGGNPVREGGDGCASTSKGRNGLRGRFAFERRRTNVDPPAANDWLRTAGFDGGRCATGETMSESADRSDLTPGACGSERLIATLYDDLRAMAARKLARERDNLTLQPTALVHEAWLRVEGSGQSSWQNRAHFFAAAAEAMRRILIDRARQRKALRHGGGAQRVDLDELQIQTEHKDEEMLAVNDALEAFAAEHPQQAELVKLRYFAGMTIEEAASAMEVSPATAKRWWTFARAWLYREISR
jgi:RNA polymerase sigma factor (TIGR02999 family)